MYCPKCRVTLDESHSFCPICGERLSPDAHNFGVVVDQSVVEERRSNTGRRVTFNFSKPLSLIIAALVIATMLLPWFSFNATADAQTIINNKETGIFELRKFAKQQFNKVMSFSSPFVKLDEKGEKIVHYTDMALTAVTLYFGICFLHLALFGLIGLFSKGRLRYYFARVGGTMYLIGTFVLLAGGLLFRLKLQSIMFDINKQSVFNVTFDYRVLYGLFIAFGTALIFRLLFIRLLRYLNGTSCFNRGDMKTAEREFRIIRCSGKTQRTFSKSKLRRGRRAYTEQDIAHGYREE